MPNKENLFPKYYEEHVPIKPVSYTHLDVYKRQMMDHFNKFIKLYPVNRATTEKILGVVTSYYIPEIGKPASIITDHGTQFKGRRWKNTLITLGIKTYKTSVYHPSSNPAERVLREVGRILRTYCHNQQRKWQEYLSATEEFLNLAHHPAIGTTPYTCLLYTSRCV